MSEQTRRNCATLLRRIRWSIRRPRPQRNCWMNWTRRMQNKYEKDERAAQSAALEEIKNRFDRAVGHLEELRKPHWTTTPTFWVALGALVVGVIGIVLTYLAWQNPKAVSEPTAAAKGTPLPLPSPKAQSPTPSPNAAAISLPTPNPAAVVATPKPEAQATPEPKATPIPKEALPPPLAPLLANPKN